MPNSVRTTEGVTEEALRCRALVQSAADAIIGIDIDGAIVSWNAGAEQLYQYRAEEAVGSHISSVIPAECAKEYGGLLERGGRGQATRAHETVGMTRNGSLIDVAVTISPVRGADGAITGVSMIARDVSEQRWMAGALDASLTGLEQALAAAQEAEARSRRFLADAAHQLRNPIAGVHACGEALLHGPDEPDRDRLLGELLRETSRARRLVASLLQIARLDQGQGVTPSRCDVVTLCREEVDRMWVLAPHLDVVLRADLGGHQPLVDANAVREVLANLLDNGRRHAATRIEVVVAVAGACLEVRVADDGPGMAPDVAERAFQRFVSLDGKGGSGLGLPIARGFARAHGGDLTYEKDSFVLRLPLEEEAERTESEVDP